MISALGGDIVLAKTQPVSTVQSHNVPKAIEKACDYLLNRQQSKGFWVGELEGDITLESDYVILQLWLHQPNKKRPYIPKCSGTESAGNVLQRTVRTQEL